MAEKGKEGRRGFFGSGRRKKRMEYWKRKEEEGPDFSFILSPFPLRRGAKNISGDVDCGEVTLREEEKQKEG